VKGPFHRGGRSRERAARARDGQLQSAFDRNAAVLINDKQTSRSARACFGPPSRREPELRERPVHEDSSRWAAGGFYEAVWHPPAPQETTNVLIITGKDRGKKGARGPEGAGPEKETA